MKQEHWKVQVDPEGKIQLPEQLTSSHGIHPGDLLRFSQAGQNLRLDYSPHFLRRVYVEPTNTCNLTCSTCMRNQWNESGGFMDLTMFEKILSGLQSFTPIPEIFFGGLGEPLVHPEMTSFLIQALERGFSVSIITNGILLTPEFCNILIQQKVEWIWVSIDGASAESYQDVRLAAELPTVIGNLELLNQKKAAANSQYPRLGIAFVAMKKNIGDLPKIIQMGKRLGAEKYSVSNVVVYSEDIHSQTLYELFGTKQTTSGYLPSIIQLPVMDFNDQTGEVITEIMKLGVQVQFGDNEEYSAANRCPFVEKGSTSIRWDGAVSPCLPLTHHHSGNLFDHPRVSEAYTVGDLHCDTLKQVWESAEYRLLRQRLQDFDFSPCVYCNSCENAEQNREDCFGNTAPACGGCLWAQGLIRCP